MSFHSHTSQKWSQNWYIALILLPVILYGVLTFVSGTVFVIGFLGTIGFYFFARKRFHQSGNRIRSKEKAILAAGISLLIACALGRSDFVDGGINASVDDWMFVLEMTLLVGTYLFTLLSIFLPDGIYEAIENKVDTGQANSFIIGG